MSTDTPPSEIPEGQAIMLAAERIEMVRSGDAVTGFLIDGYGRISITIAGTGMRAVFTDPDALIALAASAWNAAHQLAERQVTASEAAAAELTSIATAFQRSEGTPDNA